MTSAHHGANVPRENTDSGQSERGQKTRLRHPSTAREAKNKQWRAAQAPKAGHLQWPATGARKGFSSCTQREVADKSSITNRENWNSKQSHLFGPKTGPSLTDKSWITRGLKPQAPKAGHLQWPASGARKGFSSCTQREVADKSSNTNRENWNSKQSDPFGPKNGPSPTDKSWITRGLKPDSKLTVSNVARLTHVYSSQTSDNFSRQDQHQDNFTRKMPRGTPPPPPPAPLWSFLRGGAQSQKDILPNN